MPSIYSALIEFPCLPPAVASLKHAGLGVMLLRKCTLHTPNQSLFVPADLLQYLVSFL